MTGHDDALHDERGPEPWPEYPEVIGRIDSKAALRKANAASAFRNAPKPLHLVTVDHTPFTSPSVLSPAEWWAVCSCGWEGRHHGGESWSAYSDACRDRDQHNRETR